MSNKQEINEVVLKSVFTGFISSCWQITATNLCKDLHHLGLVGWTDLKELSPPLFGINQEQPFLLSRPLLLQRLLIKSHKVVKYRNFNISSTMLPLC